MATKKTSPKQAPKTAKAKTAKPQAKKTPVKKAAAKKPQAKKPEAQLPVAEPGKKLSQFQAAIRVLADAGEPMTCKAMVETMNANGLWTSPGGKTPEATLYSSILRDTRKGKDAQFRKADRGLFTLASKK